MLNKEKIYITGHRHPDTDSIASAIAYAKLKQRQGFHAIACRLGPVNAETEYLLERFHMDLPMLFEDARATLDEIEIDGPLAISPQTTIMETLELMSEQNKQSYGVINAQGKLMGMVTKSDLGYSWSGRYCCRYSASAGDSTRIYRENGKWENDIHG